MKKLLVILFIFISLAGYSQSGFDKTFREAKLDSLRARIDSIYIFGPTSFKNNSIFQDKIGIGVSSPSEALEVDGNIDLNNTNTNQLLLPTYASLTNPTIKFNTGLGIYSNAGLLYFIVNSTQIAGFSSVGMFCGAGSAGNAYILRNVSSATVPGFSFVSDTDLGIGRAGVNQMSLIAGGVSALVINDAEAHSVAGIANYETLVTNDDDIPNKKYVDDNYGGGVVYNGFYEGTSVDYGDFYDAISSFIPNTNDEMIISGSFATSPITSLYINIVSKAKRISATTITIYILRVASDFTFLTTSINMTSAATIEIDNISIAW